MKRNIVTVLGGAALLTMGTAPASAISVGGCLADYISATNSCTSSDCHGAAMLQYQICMASVTDTAPPDCDATPRAEGCGFSG